MAIKRLDDLTVAQYTVNLNVTMSGSKRMSRERQEALLQVGKVRVLIADASDPDNVLLDTEVGAREFSSGSVGYGVQERGLQFTNDLPF